MVLNVHRNTIRLIRDGEKGVWRWGEREGIYLSLHCHHQNDSCIKMGSDESHFNVSVGSDGQSHRTVSTNHNLFEEERRAEAVSNRGPSAYQPNALPLGQTGSLGCYLGTEYLLYRSLETEMRETETETETETGSERD